MEINTRNNVFSKRIIVISLSAVALLGGTVAATTAASASAHHPVSSSKHHQHRTLPRGYHYKSIKNPDCGKDQHAIIVWADKADSSVMICRNGSKVETS